MMQFIKFCPIEKPNVARMPALHDLKSPALVSTSLQGASSTVAMRHSRFDTVNAGHACGSLTVWVTASALWFDSRGMCDDLPRLDWAHSPPSVFDGQYFYSNVRWGNVWDKWDNPLEGLQPRDDSMFLWICQAGQPRGQSVYSLFYTLTGQSDEGAAWLLLWRRMWGKMEGVIKTWRRGDASPSLGSQLRPSDAGFRLWESRRMSAPVALRLGYFLTAFIDTVMRTWINSHWGSVWFPPETLMNSGLYTALLSRGLLYLLPKWWLIFSGSTILDCLSISESVHALKRLFVFAQWLLPLDWVELTAVLILLSAVWLQTKSMKYSFWVAQFLQSTFLFHLSKAVEFSRSFIKAFLEVNGHNPFNYSFNVARYKGEETWQAYLICSLLTCRCYSH